MALAAVRALTYASSSWPVPDCLASSASSAGLSAIIWLTVRSRSRASGSPASTWASSPPVPNRKRRNATSTDSPGPRLLTASSRWVSNPSNRAWATDTEVRAYGNAGVRVDLVESECTYHGETIAGRFRVAQFWVTEAGRWQLAAVQYTAVRDQS